MKVEEEETVSTAVEAAPLETGELVRRYPTNAKNYVKLKREDREDGLVGCPRCGSGISASATGCNIVTCFRSHPQTLSGTTGGGQGGWVYFCYHCGVENNGEPCGGAMCPERVTPVARESALKMRNQQASTFPVNLTEEVATVAADAADAAAAEEDTGSVAPLPLAPKQEEEDDDEETNEEEEVEEEQEVQWEEGEEDDEEDGEEEEEEEKEEQEEE